jgi:hypothetical protein
MATLFGRRWPWAIATFALSAACSSLIGLRDDYAVKGTDVEEGGVPVGDGDSMGDGPEPPHGSVTVHAKKSTDPELTQFVIIGDGTKIPPKPIPDGRVTFEDPTLVGAQDVTLVRRYASTSYPRVEVTTLLGVLSNDVWFGADADGPVHGKVSGRVVNLSTSDGYIYGLQPFDSEFDLVSQSIAKDGQFTAEFAGPNNGPTRLLVWNNYHRPEYNVLSPAGLSAPLTLLPGQTVDAGSIALDVVFDAKLQASVRGFEPYGTVQIFAESEFFDGTPPLAPAISGFATFAVEAGKPQVLVTLDSFRPDSGLAGWSRYLTVSTMYFQSSAYGSVRSLVTGVPTLDLPWPPPTFVQPPRPPDGGTPPVVARDDFMVEYSGVSAAAQLVSVSIYGSSPDPRARGFRWNMVGAKGADGKGTFKPFMLPETIVPVSLPAGDYSIQLESLTSYDSVRANDLLGKVPGALALTGIRDQARVRADLIGVLTVARLR